VHKKDRMMNHEKSGSFDFNLPLWGQSDMHHMHNVMHLTTAFICRKYRSPLKGAK
jgi:hypothetical protein